MKKSTIRKVNIAIVVLTVFVAVALFLEGTGTIRAIAVSEDSKDDVAAFFDGAVIRWIIPNNPGGGYDQYARLIAPFLEKYTGARVHVRNIPGAGGMRGVSELFRSPANGLTIGLINGSGLVSSRIAGMRHADYEIGELSFLGRVATDTRVLVLSEQSKRTSFADILNTSESVRIGATGLGGSTYVDAVIIREAFDLNMDIVHGFDNSSAVQHAILGGKLEGAWSSWGSVIDLVALGRLKVVLQSGRSRANFLPDVPTVFEYMKITPDSLQTENLLTAWEALTEVGRPVVAPPGIQSDRRDYLREAFRQALHDPVLLESAAKAGRVIVFASGEEMGDIISRASMLPPEMQQIFNRVVRSGLQ